MADEIGIDVQVLSDWGNRVGEEARKSFARYLREGFIEKYLSGSNVLDIGYRGYIKDVHPIVPHAIGVELDYPGYDGVTLPFADNSQDAVFSSHTLEHIADYRTILRDWFRVVKVGGHMIISVPHQYLYERKLHLPSNFNADHKRFYTPSMLLMQVEEALDPYSYRVRLLEDNDRGFDYSIPPGHHAGGCYEIVLVLQKIARPAWADLAMTLEPEPEPPRQFFHQIPKETAVERIAAVIPHPTSVSSVLVNKLDHRGDFIIAEKAFRILRSAFPQAKLILACGPWNQPSAEALGLFDEIVPVPFFPEDVRHGAPVADLDERVALFEDQLTGRSFDVAIDLRIDPDTRRLLKHVDAHYRVGFGSREAWPFLDFSLDLANPTYTGRAERYQIPAGAFHALPGKHQGYRISLGESNHTRKRRSFPFTFLERNPSPTPQGGEPRMQILVHGPYQPLGPGSYSIKPIVDTRGKTVDLRFDMVAKAGHTLLARGELSISPMEVQSYHLVVEEPISDFEFRIFGDPQKEEFDFFGLSVTKKGDHTSFHQEEALVMLSVMAALRLEAPFDTVMMEAGA